MASVTFDHVIKRFGETTAVNDLNIEVGDKEFLVLVGPSAARQLLCVVWPGWKRSPKARSRSATAS